MHFKNEDMQEILEQKPVIITDLLEISEIKRAFHQDLIIIYIKCMKMENNN